MADKYSGFFQPGVSSGLTQLGLGLLQSAVAPKGKRMGAAFGALGMGAQALRGGRDKMIQDRLMQLRMAGMERENDLGIARAEYGNMASYDPTGEHGADWDAPRQGAMDAQLRKAYPEMWAKQQLAAPAATYSRVDDPYGRGGVGQLNSVTGQVTGYQAKAEPAGPPPTKTRNVGDQSYTDTWNPATQTFDLGTVGSPRWKDDADKGFESDTWWSKDGKKQIEVPRNNPGLRNSLMQLEWTKNEPRKTTEQIREDAIARAKGAEEGKPQAQVLPGRSRPAVFGSKTFDIAGRILNGEATEDDKRLYRLLERDLTQDKSITNSLGEDVLIRGEDLPWGYPKSDGKGGFTWEGDGREPAGAEEKPAEGPLAKPIPPDQAGKLAMIQMAQKTIGTVRDAIIRPDGSIDRVLIAQMNVDIPLLGSGIPFTQGRMYRAQFEDVASAKLRLETGAQANQGEITGIVDRFMPSIGDSKEGIIDKLSRMEEFFSLSLEKTNPKLYHTLKLRAAEEKSGKDKAGWAIKKKGAK